jgi:hypothetical protein
VRSDGSSYQGTARRFREGMKPNLYAVAGPIKKGGNQVVLSGTVQTRNVEGAVIKTFEDVLVFDLLPKYP